ncbi:MAG: endo-1,4-beta-xylanase [Bacteroidales bacterium]|nr:endo-1,4-beta-xylanase [Bacteroidales bacterium]
MRRMNATPGHTGIKFFIAVTGLLCMFSMLSAQSAQEWYDHAQERIDTLRKGSFGLVIIDKNDQPFTGDVSVRLTKHEYPFGIAFDLYEGAVNNGNRYSTTNTITADADAEIYQSERYYSFLAYAIPVEEGRDYILTLKFAEIYFTTTGSRIFDVFVEGDKVLSDFDMVAVAGDRNIAIDTSFTITAADTLINLEMVASLDNAAIKGIEIRTVEGDWVEYINCGGGALTTSDGHDYLSDEDFFDGNASRFPSEEQWMKATMQKYFNYGVSGNSFKWSGIQPQHTEPDYTNFEHAVSWTQSIGWDLRAHTLLWGGYEYTGDHEMPRWVKDLPTPEAITDTCKMRVSREVSRYKGIIKEYDVMNEPLHATYLSDIVGDSINWNCFKWAREADPDAELFINEYNVEYNWGDAAAYRDLVLKIKEEGGPVIGVGMQAHFWDGMRPNITELVTNVNIVAEAGLPIKFTEFDNGSELTEAQQAEDVVKVFTIAFSHPMMNGVVSWALSDAGAWRENSGYFDDNRRPKLAADTLFYLLNEHWATKFDTTLVDANPVLFDAYYGDYTVEVNFGDMVKVFTIPCLEAHTDSVFILHETDAVIRGPEVVSAVQTSDSSLVITFDKPIQDESIIGGDFKFFSDHAMRIQDIKTDAADSSLVHVTLQGVITPDDYLCVSYFPGSLASTDGGKSKAFGPVEVINLSTGLISAEVTNDGYTIEASFNYVVRGLLDNEASFTLTDNGEALSFDEFDYMEGDSSMAVFHFSTPLTSANAPRIQYTGGTLTNDEGFACQSSAVLTVKNYWPQLVSSQINSAGTRAIALFDGLLEDVVLNQDAFTLSVDGQPAEISSITANGVDSTKIVFNLTEKVYAGQEVSLSYQPGTVKATNGNSLLGFEDAQVNNASTAVDNLETVIEQGLTIFPNPAHDQLQVSWEKGFTSLVLFNLEGKEVVRENLTSPATNLTLSLELKSGIYLLRLVNGAESTEAEVIIK